MNPLHKLLGAVSLLGAIGELVEALSYAKNAKTEREALDRLTSDPDRWHTIRMGDCVFSRGDLEQAERLVGSDEEEDDEEEDDDDE